MSTYDDWKLDNGPYEGPDEGLDALAEAIDQDNKLAIASHRAENHVYNVTIETECHETTVEEDGVLSTDWTIQGRIHDVQSVDDLNARIAACLWQTRHGLILKPAPRPVNTRGHGYRLLGEVLFAIVLLTMLGAVLSIWS